MKVVFSSVPRLVNGLVIASETMPAMASWMIQRICCAGFRNSSNMIKTTGNITSPPRERVSSRDTIIGTSIKP
ncbi:hypothetical protein D3C73_1321810 [compost metagenome]